MSVDPRSQSKSLVLLFFVQFVKCLLPSLAKRHQRFDINECAFKGTIIHFFFSHRWKKCLPWNETYFKMPCNAKWSNLERKNPINDWNAKTLIHTTHEKKICHKTWLFLSEKFLSSIFFKRRPSSIHICKMVYVS